MTTATKEPTTQALALAPATLNEWVQLAEYMAKSSIVPKDFCNKPSDCLIAMQMGVSVGLNPFQAIQSIAVINGRPCMWGDAVLGVSMSSPVFEDIDEVLDESTMTATCTVKRKGKEKPVIRTFSMADAKAAKVYVKDAQGNGRLIPLADKQGPWQAYPKRMLQMRARALALRDAFPDVLKGIAVREEVEDYDNEPREPKVVGGQTLEERIAEMMPREKQPESGGEANGSQGEPHGGGAILPSDGTAGSTPATATTLEPEQPELPAGQTEPEPVERPAKTVKFSIGKQTFETAGIIRKQMISLFDLCPKVGKKYGASKPREVLVTEFGVEHRADLTEEQAEQYIIRMTEMLEG